MRDVLDDNIERIWVALRGRRAGQPANQQGMAAVPSAAQGRLMHLLAPMRRWWRQH